MHEQVKQRGARSLPLACAHAHVRSGHSLLHLAVCALAHRARAEAASPQQLLVAVKRVFRAPAYAQTTRVLVEALLEGAVTWAIHACYAPDADASGAPRAR